MIGKIKKLLIIFSFMLFTSLLVASLAGFVSAQKTVTVEFNTLSFERALLNMAGLITEGFSCVAYDTDFNGVLDEIACTNKAGVTLIIVRGGFPGNLPDPH